MTRFLFMEGPPKIGYPKYEPHINVAINLDKVISLHKSRMSWYPDNEGVPSIKFQMEGQKEHLEWIFSSNDKRDYWYDQILGKREAEG